MQFAAAPSSRRYVFEGFVSTIPTIGSVVPLGGSGFTEIFYAHDGADTVVFADTNDNGVLDATDFAVRLSGHHNLSSADFGTTAFAIRGTAGNDTLTGTSQADAIFGMAGDDTIYGLDGADNLNGGDDNDTIFGGDSSSFGLDKIDLRGSGLSFADLAIDDSGYSAVITSSVGRMEVTLVGQASTGALTPVDFLFG